MTDLVIENSNHRQEEWDILKGIGIILVMFGHALPENGLAHNLIYGFHMPLFFFCSGVFYRRKHFWKGIVRDIRLLMVPYLTFSLFLVVCSIILSRFSNGDGPVFRPLDENCYVLYYTIWFLPCLFLTRLLYRIIDRVNNDLIASLLCGGGYFVAFALKTKGFNIPFFVDSAIGMLLFYHCGHLFQKIGVLCQRFPLWCCFLLLVLYVIFVWFVQPKVNIKDNQFPLYLIVLSMTPIYSLFQLSCVIKSKFLSYCGVASLAIMGLHHPIYDVAMWPLLNRIDLPFVVESLIMVTITLFIVLTMYQLMVKYTPFLLGKSRLL